MDQRNPKEPQNSKEGQTRICCVNQSATSVAHSPVQHDQMKHVNIDWHWIRETLDEYKTSTPYIGSFKQLANVSITGLSKDQRVKLSSKLGLTDIHSSA